MHWAVLDTSYGPMVLAATDKGLCALAFVSDAAESEAVLRRRYPRARLIPAGETRSYGELAAALGNPKASRAVGGANGANHVAVLIPCHRVIAGDGTLGGSAWGLEVKAELLRREGWSNPQLPL